MNLTTCTNISSTIHLGTFTYLSTSKRVIKVGFNSPRLRLWKTEYGSKFTLASRSSKAFSILCSPIKHKIVGQPGSLYFKALLFWRITLTCLAKNAFFYIQFSIHSAQIFQKFSIRRYPFNSIQQRYIDPYLFESFKDFRVVIDSLLFGHGMRKWKCWWRINLFIAMFRLNPFLTLIDWLIIFLTRFKSGFFNNLTTVKSDDWFNLIHVLAFGITCICIVLPLWILLWLRWKLAFLLKTKSRCEFCKSIFKICHTLSKLSVDCLLLFYEYMQCFPKISSRRWSIRRWISIGILEIMVCLKWWLWSLCITLPTEIWVISPTRVIRLWVWVMIGPLETV